MRVTILDAKSQLPRLVKAALAGEEVIIASHGSPQVKLVPCAAAGGLKQTGGALAAALPDGLAARVDAGLDDCQRDRATPVTRALLGAPSGVSSLL